MSTPPRLVGVVHLPPLPGSPRARREATALVDAIVEGVVKDVRALADARFDAVIVENFGDAPFAPGAVEPIAIAAMTRAVQASRDAAPSLSLGVNVLRNDALSALAVAAAAGAGFVRINVHVGAVVTDQGLIEGRAYETLRARRSWGAESVAIWADVDVKHAVPFGPRGVDLAHDAVLRGLADAVLVTGRATGAPADPDALAELHRALPHTPIYVASGAVPEQLGALAEAGAHGVVVGSWLRTNGEAGGPIDRTRAASFAESFRRVFR